VSAHSGLPPSGLAANRWIGAVQVAWLGAAALLTVAAVAIGSTTLAAGALVLAFAGIGVPQIESWRVLLGALLVVIFTIPIKRYQLPVDLPFDLEPYRLLVMFLAGVWVAALLIDPRVHLRRSRFDIPLIVFFFALMISVSVNVEHVTRLEVTTDVVKALSFFASFLLVYFLVFSVIRTRDDIEFLVRAMVVCSAGVAFFAMIEYRTNQNLFNRLSDLIPLLEFRGDPVEGIARSDRLRVYASAQHPIALAASLMMVLPLALYVAQTTRRAFWWLSAFLIGLGSLATLSRTGVVMAAAAAIALWAMRPVETKRLVPLALPALLVVFIALPNALGSFKSAFFPKGGIVAEQSAVVYGNQLRADNRLADIGPTLAEWRQRPAFGQGFGSRIVDLDRQNARVLDNQWLALLLEAGAIGVGLLIWLYVRSIRALGRLARRDSSSLGLLAGSLGASIASLAVGMLTFDAFSFIQVTFVLFVVLALAASVLALAKPAPVAREAEGLSDPVGQGA
jgi:polysaccharide biosynthesis protein PslJ